MLVVRAGSKCFLALDALNISSRVGGRGGWSFFCSTTFRKAKNRPEADHSWSCSACLFVALCLFTVYRSSIHLSSITNLSSWFVRFAQTPLCCRCTCLTSSLLIITRGLSASSSRCNPAVICSCTQAWSSTVIDFTSFRLSP